MSNAVTARTAPAALQCAGAAVMVRPAAFGFNVETATSNRFQVAGGRAAEDALSALAEFDAMAGMLRAAGVRLCVLDDTATPVKPDAVFPNNWVSFHADGTVVLYPMLTPNRRRERRPELIEAACRELQFIERRRIDLSGNEVQGRILEGTGSLVLDHRERVAYACRSARTDESLVNEWCRLLGYEPVVFDASTPDGQSVYHTNVLLWIGEQAAGVGCDWIAAADRDRVVARLRASGRAVLELPARALAHFAGNMLELSGRRNGSPSRVLVLSQAAATALAAPLRAQLAAATDQLLVVPAPTIERLGGGSVRCMLAEVPA